MDDAMQLLAEHLGAVELLPCPACDHMAPRSRAGHPALCLHCTQVELGLSWQSNAARINNGRILRTWIADEVPQSEWIPRRSWAQLRRMGMH